MIVPLVCAVLPLSNSDYFISAGTPWISHTVTSTWFTHRSVYGDLCRNSMPSSYLRRPTYGALCEDDSLTDIVGFHDDFMALSYKPAGRRTVAW